MSKESVDLDKEASVDFNPFSNSRPTLPTTSNYVAPPPFNPAIRAPSQTDHRNANEATPILTDKRIIEATTKPLRNLSDDLEKRDNEIRQPAADVRDEDRINNFPPCSRCMPCKSCFYQDFDRDIEPRYRPTVKLGYYLWLAESVLLLVNVFGTFAYMIASNTNPTASGTFGVSILLFVLFVPLSYLFWFRPLYKCLRSQSSVSFFVFFIFIMLHIILDIIQCLGINWLGSCGWINSISVIGSNLGVGFFMFTIASGFTIIVIVKIFLLVKVHRLYRRSGASFDKAKSEIGRDAVVSIVTT